jgi:hypothetical protein
VQGKARQGRAGQRKSKEDEEQGRTGQGRAGQSISEQDGGRIGQRKGRAGKGRAGQGRAAITFWLLKFCLYYQSQLCMARWSFKKARRNLVGVC